MYLVSLIDEDKCVGCRMCIQICPEPNAIVYLKAKKKARVVAIRCKGCGICEVSCPKKAIVMVLQKQPAEVST
ncbi:MAG TPA: 4Fe-4S dicluster domain-containing protein [Chthonomonadales bacterium]|nr:4Fe-4S dicluster domain-containing protein [Chthonomonadales bacterium]